MQTLDNLSFIDLKPYSAKESRVHTALKERSCFKLICGGFFNSPESIKLYSNIFAKAGAHIINVPANPKMITAAKEGIEAANVSSEVQPQIMVSISLDHEMDPRSKRKNLDNLLTNESNVSEEDNQNENIKASNFSLTSESLSEMWSLGATYLEIQVGSNFYWLESYIRKIKELSPHPWMISISLNSQVSSLNELIEQADEIHNLLGEGALVQIDGNPINNNFISQNKDISMLRAITGASAIIEADKALLVMVSGGINESMKTLLNRFGLKVNGMAMGEYPQKLLEAHIDDTDTAVAIASKLVNSIKN